MDISQIIIMLATPLVTLVGVILANRKSNALMSYQIEELKKEVEKHNGVIGRVCTLEKDNQNIHYRLNEHEDDIKRLSDKIT